MIYMMHILRVLNEKVYTFHTYYDSHDQCFLPQTSAVPVKLTTAASLVKVRPENHVYTSLHSS